MRHFTEREQVVEVVNRLFYYTDFQEWDKLIIEVFASEVMMDMVSLGAEKAVNMTPQEICQSWEDGFKDLDAVHHQSGNNIVEINEDKKAHVKSYAIASHYKKNAQNGKERRFIGSYDFHLVKQSQGWRIDRFKFNLKYVEGNVELT